MILGWIFVHGGTKGTYKVESLSNVSATVGGFMLLIGLAAFGTGISADPGFGFSVLLAAVCWFTIVLMRSSLTSDAKGNEEVRMNIARQMLEEQRRFQREQRFETPDQIRERVQEAERQFIEQQERSRAQVERIMQRPPAVKPAQVDPAAAPPDLDGSLRLAGRELQPARLESKASAATPPAGYETDVQEVQQLVATALGIATDPPAAEAEPAQPVPEVPPAETGSAEMATEVQQAAPEALQPAAEVDNSAPAEPELQRGWQAPRIEHAHYELDNTGERPVSIFGSQSESGASLFGSPAAQPETPHQHPPQFRPVQASHLLPESELPVQSADSGNADDAEEQESAREGFHYRPTEGIKSRF